MHGDDLQPIADEPAAGEVPAAGPPSSAGYRHWSKAVTTAAVVAAIVSSLSAVAARRDLARHRETTGRVVKMLDDANTRIDALENNVAKLDSDISRVDELARTAFVPNVVGERLDAALDALHAVGLDAVFNDDASPRTPSAIVTVQNPAPGARAQIGWAVEIETR